jgi:hypothetical protein
MTGEREDGSRYGRVDFFGNAAGLAEGPQSFKIEHWPTDRFDDVVTVVPPHFHRVRQFQLILEGDRSGLGKSPAPPYSFHYADPSQPYGPIVAGDGGIAWLTLRPQHDLGLHPMPGSQSKMMRRGKRNVVVPGTAEPLLTAGLEERRLIDRQDDGLAALRLRLGPGVEAVGPDPSGSGGQYWAILAGTVVQAGESYAALSLGWVAEDEEPAQVAGGPEGADVIVLQFPVGNPAIEIPDPEAPMSVRRTRVS